MNILIACEESQAVCIAFRNKGHRAFSCDLFECSGGHPEWHIKGDCIPLLNGNCVFTTQDTHTHTQDGKWDMILAFPPCTHLTVSGARHFEKKRLDGSQEDGLNFFCKFLDVDCDKVAIENPVNIISGNYVKQWFPDTAQRFGLPLKPNQRIQPYEFGHPQKKTTCLWLKGLPNLVPTNIVTPEEDFVYTNGKTYPNWMMETLRKCKTPEERSKARSKTFIGIANAMAEQWTNN